MQTYKIPLRINLSASIWDIPESLGFYTGSSVSAPIDKFVTVEFVDDTSRPPYVEPDYEIIQSLLSKIPIAQPIQVRWKSDLPLGLGLGGSSALLVGVARHFFRNWYHQAEIAGAVEIERGAGWGDPCSVAYGRTALWRFSRLGFLLKETFRPLNSDDFMLINTQQRHDTADQYKTPVKATSEGYDENERHVKQFCKAIRNGDPKLVGELLTEIHWIKKKQRLNYVTSKMNCFFQEALQWSWGGRLMGSGGGGCFVFALPRYSRDKLRDLASGYGYVEILFNFLEDGI